MSARKFTIKRGDTLPVLEVELALDGVAVDLTGASVEFYFRRGSTTITRNAELAADPTTGRARYEFRVVEDWTSEDFSVGSYRFEIQVTFADGSILTVPTSGYNKVVVTQDLAD